MAIRTFRRAVSRSETLSHHELPGGGISAGKKKDGDYSGVQIEDDLLETFDIDDLIALLPRDTVQLICNPTVQMVKAGMSKDLPADQAQAIKPYFDCPDEKLEVKKKLLLKIIEKYFPNSNLRRVSPEVAFIIMELAQTTEAVRNSRNHLAEINALNGGEK